jgi:hypothetical protein
MSATVQETHGLVRARLNRHAAAQEIRAEFRELDSEVRRQQPAVPGLGVLDGRIGEPDCHLHLSLA